MPHVYIRTLSPGSKGTISLRAVSKSCIVIVHHSQTTVSFPSISRAQRATSLHQPLGVGRESQLAPKTRTALCDRFRAFGSGSLLCARDSGNHYRCRLTQNRGAPAATFRLMGLLDGKNIVVTASSRMRRSHSAWRRSHKNRGANIVLTGAGRALRLTQRNRPQARHESGRFRDRSFRARRHRARARRSSP